MVDTQASDVGIPKEIEKENTTVETKVVVSDVTETVPTLTKRVVLKNLTVLSMAFLLLFTSFHSLQNLQSSLNKEDGLGTISLSVIYVFMMVSSFILPPLVIRHLGCKWTIAASIVCYIIYMAANFHAVWGTMIPASIIIGFGSSPLWTAKCTYLTHIAAVYSEQTNVSRDGTLGIFFGVFFMCFQTSQIWGNLISSLVFKQNEINTTTSDVAQWCGASYCPSDYINNTNLDRPNMQKIYTLCGIYLAFACLAVLVIVFFLDNLKLDKGSEKGTGMLVSATVRHFYRSGYQKLLIPISVYTGVEQAYVYGDFTRSFVSCAAGVWSVGFVMIAYGIASASFSFIVGRLVRHTSFIPWVFFGFLVHGSSLVTMLVWHPTVDAVFVFYVLAVLWGIGHAVMQTLINAYYGYLFSGKPEKAFASYRLCESAGFILVFGYSSFLCTNIKIWVCLALLTVGVTLFGVTEVHHRRTKKDAVSTEDE